MASVQTRRHFIAGTSGVILAACATDRDRPPRVSPPRSLTTVGETSLSETSLSETSVSEVALAEIEARVGGRLGVFALDTANERHLAHRADERFAMCSTFKWVLAAAILHRVERNVLSLTERVSYDSRDLLEYAPVTRAHVAQGWLTLGALAEAAVTVSDNTAANLLLNKMNGPADLTKFVRTAGDAITRLDRYEPALNSNEPGDPRDTTSPRAMVGLMRALLCTEALAATSRERLVGWLRASETGKNRIRAGLPENWAVGDKTGSCSRNAVNDVAIAFPPGRAPVLVAVYMSDGGADMTAMEAAHAEVARLVAHEL